MQAIRYQGQLIGIKISAIQKGTIPLEADEEPLQLVSLKRPKGTYTLPHYHKSRHLVTRQVQECLFVRKGRLKADIYTKKAVFVTSVALKDGDVFILLNGCYGLHMLTDVELFETKNGPYLNDKVLINAA